MMARQNWMACSSAGNYLRPLEWLFVTVFFIWFSSVRAGANIALLLGHVWFEGFAAGNKNWKDPFLLVVFGLRDWHLVFYFQGNEKRKNDPH